MKKTSGFKRSYRKRKTIGIRLTHHLADNTWYQSVCQCIFYSGSQICNSFTVSRAKLEDKDDLQNLFDKLKIKKYDASDKIECFGSPDVCKAHALKQAALAAAAKQVAASTKDSEQEVISVSTIDRLTE